MVRIALTAFLILLGCTVNAQKQTDTASHRFILVGAGYTFTRCYDTTGDQGLDYSYTLNESIFHGGAIDAIYHTRISWIGFHLQARYINDRFSRTTERDPRLPSNGGAYINTTYRTQEHVATLATYFAFTTKGRNAWMFFELGPELSAGLAGTTTQTDYYRDYAATPTPPYATIAIPGGTTKSGFRIKAVQAGLRIGLVGNILNSWYGSAFVQGRFFGPKELLPTSGRSVVVMANLNVYYRLPYE